MPLRIHFLDVKKYEVGQGEKLLHISVPDSSVCVDADVDAVLFQHSEKGKEFLCLGGWFAARECHPSLFPEERLFIDCPPQNLLGSSQVSTVKADCVGICTVQTPEWTSLQKDH